MSTLIGYARVQAAIHHVCQSYAVTKDQLMSRERPEYIAWPRQVAIWVAWNTSDLTQEELGPIFHRTLNGIRYSIDAVRDRIQAHRKTYGARVYELQSKVAHEKIT